MSCMLEFPESSVRIDFCCNGNKQKILIDVLIKYGEMDVTQLASALEIPLEKLQKICQGSDFLFGESAENLAQLFLLFLGKHFLRKCTVIRTFAS